MKNSDGFTVVADSITIAVSKVALPITSLKTHFKLSARFRDVQNLALGNIDFSGWLDWTPKDMDAQLSLRDFNVAYFSPYFSDFISHKKLESALLNTESAFKAVHNDLSIDTNLKLSKMEYAQDENTRNKTPRRQFVKNLISSRINKETLICVLR